MTLRSFSALKQDLLAHAFLHSPIRPTPVDLSVLRALRSAARVFDDTPALRGLLVRAPALLRMFGGNGTFFVPGRPLNVGALASVEDYAALRAAVLGDRSMTSLVRHYFRSCLNDRKSLEPQAYAVVKYLNTLQVLAAAVKLQPVPSKPAPFESLSPEWSEIRPGMLLVAHPLADEAWSRSVVLLTRHDVLKGGTEGYILNKPAHTVELHVRSLLRSISGRTNRGRKVKVVEATDVEPHLYRGSLTTQKLVERLILNQLHAKRKSETFYGGPVPSAELLHSDHVHARTAVQETGIFMGAKEKARVDGTSETFEFTQGSLSRKFVGCAAWAPGQLAHEITEGFWIPVTVNDAFELRNIVFNSTGDKLWKNVMGSLGEDFAQLARLPVNASKLVDFDDESGDDVKWSEAEDWEKGEFDR